MLLDPLNLARAVVPRQAEQSQKTVQRRITMRAREIIYLQFGNSWSLCVGSCLLTGKCPVNQRPKTLSFDLYWLWLTIGFLNYIFVSCLCFFFQAHPTFIFNNLGDNSLLQRCRRIGKKCCNWLCWRQIGSIQWQVLVQPTAGKTAAQLTVLKYHSGSYHFLLSDRRNYRNERAMTSTFTSFCSSPNNHCRPSFKNLNCLFWCHPTLPTLFPLEKKGKISFWIATSRVG